MKSIQITICKNGECNNYRIPKEYGFDLVDMIALSNPAEAKMSGATMPEYYIEKIEIEE
ncbi:MAG: hypothetical protein HGB03_00385 [Candidatus Yonathbacteria bacterium]|nr:hypothetical protein [Candidatus Yonathbacteria bacterium]NTW47724.1 hypothetical protein [Candidatus Yonathbacteria bacterium]